MKTLVIHASPNDDGLTATAAEAALRGAQAAGAEGELISLRKLDIQACRACDEGWGLCRSENRCVTEDDFQQVRTQMSQADALVLVTPVYFGDLSEVLKSYLDRLRRCEFTFADSKLAGTPVLLMAAAGGGGGGGPTALHALEVYCNHLRLPVFDWLVLTRRNRDYMLVAAQAAGEALVGHAQAEG